MGRKKKIESLDDAPKVKSLFDHVNAIRRDKNPNYFSTLSDSDKKTFNNYMILRCLSMDKSVIEEIAYISKYFDKMPPESFYKLCCEITPPTRNFFPYIKSKKEKYNDKLIECLTKKFDISTKEASLYCGIFYSIENGVDELIDILRGFGLTEKESNKIVNSDK